MPDRLAADFVMFVRHEREFAHLPTGKWESLKQSLGRHSMTSTKLGEIGHEHDNAILPIYGGAAGGDPCRPCRRHY